MEFLEDGGRCYLDIAVSRCNRLREVARNLLEGVVSGVGASSTALEVAGAGAALASGSSSGSPWLMPGASTSAIGGAVGPEVLASGTLPSGGGRSYLYFFLIGLEAALTARRLAKRFPDPI